MQTSAMISMYMVDPVAENVVPNDLALKLKTSLIAVKKAPLSSPLISLLILSATPVKRTFLIMDVMWLAGKRLHIDITLSENCDNGIYAPITKPEAAVRIPKNAVLVEEDLKRSITTIKRAVEESDPSSTMP